MAYRVGGGIVTAAVTDPAGDRVGLIVNPHFRLAATGAGTSSRSVEVETRVAASPAEVWAPWTTSEGLAKCLVPSAKVAYFERAWASVLAALGRHAGPA